MASINDQSQVPQGNIPRPDPQLTQSAPSPAAPPAAPPSPFPPGASVPRRTLADLIPALHPQQALALRAIMEGKTSDEIADLVGVSRDTLWHWRTADPLFMEALNTWRHDALEDVRRSVRATAERFKASLSPEELRRMQAAHKPRRKRKESDRGM